MNGADPGRCWWRVLGNRRVRRRCREAPGVWHRQQRHSRDGQHAERDPERYVDTDRPGENAPERKPERIERERAEPVIGADAGERLARDVALKRRLPHREAEYPRDA